MVVLLTMSSLVKTGTPSLGTVAFDRYGCFDDIRIIYSFGKMNSFPVVVGSLCRFDVTTFTFNKTLLDQMNSCA